MQFVNTARNAEPSAKVLIILNTRQIKKHVLKHITLQSRFYFFLVYCSLKKYRKTCNEKLMEKKECATVRSINCRML